MFIKTISFLLFFFCTFFLLIGAYLISVSLTNFQGELLIVNLLSSLMCFAISGALYFLRKKLNEKNID